MTTGWVLGILTVFLVHEFGHAVLARLVGAHVYRIDLLPYGGECTTSETDSELKESIIASGGVLAQLALAIPAELALASGPPAALGDFLWALSTASVLIAAFNLLPIPPLDGAKAWKLVWLIPIWAFERLRRRRSRRLETSETRRPPPKKEWLN